jgi:signal transduction histidine kinase
MQYWILYTVAGLFLIAELFFIRFRVKRIKIQKDQLEELVEKRTIDLKMANSKLEENKRKIEQQSEELRKQYEKQEAVNSLLEERQEEIEHQSLKLQIQANSLKESNDLLLQREQQIRSQAEMLEEQTESLQETNRKLLERQEETEHQSLKLKVQSQALEESNRQLEQRESYIRNQANKLEDQAEKLKNSNHELEKLNATKDRFFSIIAHDLRNPINAILGFSELLSINFDEIADEKKLELNKIIYQSTKNVYNLLENLLQWSRSQTNRIKFEPIQFDVSGIINENLILSKPNIRKKSLIINTELDKNSIVFADKNMTSAILRNLLTNSIKFSNPLGEITISTVSNNGFLEISVADTGVGMTEEVAKNLFRIDMAHSTYGTSGEKGTGLGLIICHEFVDKHGGLIKVDTEPNKGSKFTFTLPSNADILKKHQKD